MEHINSTNALEKVRNFADIKAEVIGVLDDHYYDYTSAAVARILIRWYNAKKGLIDLLSKHPNWNPDKYMIQFDQDFTRPLDSNAARVFMNKATLCINEHKVNDLLYYNLCQSVMTSECDRINDVRERYPDAHIKAGEKSTRMARKLLEYFKVPERMEANGYNFNSEFHKYCEALSPLRITRHTCISLNPVDFLLMSNGNSWDSCHYIGDRPDEAGCYSAGTISYMLDECSMVFYTVDASYEGADIELEPKMTRQIFGYNDYQILQSRSYPQNMDSGAEHIYTEYRAVVQDVFAKCLEEENSWVKGKCDNVERGAYSRNYPDWCYFNVCSVSTLRRMKDEALNAIIMGAEALCVECGEPLSDNECILCESCRRDCYICADCGTRIDDYDDVYWVNDEPYCNRCITICSHCGRAMRNDDSIYVEDTDDYICENCYDCGYYFTCEVCESIFSYDALITVDGDCYCEECARRVGARCECCDEWHYKRHMTESSDGMICDTCIREEMALLPEDRTEGIELPCTECGALHSLSELTLTENGLVCNECAQMEVA